MSPIDSAADPAGNPETPNRPTVEPKIGKPKDRATPQGLDSADSVLIRIISELRDEPEKYGSSQNSEELDLLNRFFSQHREAPKVARLLEQMARGIKGPEYSLDSHEAVIGFLRTRIELDNDKGNENAMTWKRSLKELLPEKAKLLESIREWSEALCSQLTEFNSKYPAARADRLIKMLDDSWQRTVGGEQIKSENIDGLLSHYVGVREEFRFISQTQHPLKAGPDRRIKIEENVESKEGSIRAKVDLVVELEDCTLWMEVKNRLTTANKPAFEEALDEFTRMNEIAKDPKYRRKGKRPIIGLALGQRIDPEEQAYVNEILREFDVKVVVYFHEGGQQQQEKEKLDKFRPNFYQRE